MIRRDKNKPSVIMWSIANEPATNMNISVPYFKAVIQHTKDTDPAHRPVTFVSDLYLNGPWGDKSFPIVDVICINLYLGWYSGAGQIESIEGLRAELQGFRCVIIGIGYFHLFLNLNICLSIGSLNIGLWEELQNHEKGGLLITIFASVCVFVSHRKTIFP